MEHEHAPIEDVDATEDVAEDLTSMTLPELSKKLYESRIKLQDYRHIQGDTHHMENQDPKVVADAIEWAETQIVTISAEIERRHAENI